jgi:hypothetical protein
MIAGALPAARASLATRFTGLGGTRVSASRTERRLLAAMTTLQVVLTVALLAGAALLVRTARNLDRVQPGYETEHILAMTVTTMERESGTTGRIRARHARQRAPSLHHSRLLRGHRHEDRGGTSVP